jgi:hypothetical protein
MASDLDIQKLAKALRDPLLGWGFVVPTPVTAYTPVLSGSTTPGAPTYSLQDGWYVRRGPLVKFWGRITWTALGGAAGNAQISIPIVAGTAGSGTYRFSNNLWTNNVTFGALTPQALITQAQQFFTMWTPANNAASALIAVEAAGDVVFDGEYAVA